MLKTNKADEMIESLEIKASDNYYSIEDNEDYKFMCDLVENAGYNGEEFVNKNDFFEAYKRVREEINNW